MFADWKFEVEAGPPNPRVAVRVYARCLDRLLLQATAAAVGSRRVAVMGTSSSQPAPPVAEPKQEAPAPAGEGEGPYSQTAFSVTPPPLTAVAPKDEVLENPGEIEELGRKAKG